MFTSTTIYRTALMLMILLSKSSLVLGATALPTATEWFLFLGEGLPPLVKKHVAYELPRFLGETTKPGDLLHIVAVPSHQPIVTITIPEGSQNSRLRKRDVRRALALVAPLLRPGNTNQKSNQLHLASIPATIASLRRTNSPPRLLLVADPIYHEPNLEKFSMQGGRVPTDGSLRSSLFPLVDGVINFPKGTEVVWLGIEPNWGLHHAFRSAAQRYYRLWFQEQGSTLRRFTLSAAAAFGPQSTDPIARITPRTDGVGMEEIGFRSKEGQMQRRTWRLVPLPNTEGATTPRAPERPLRQRATPTTANEASYSPKPPPETEPITFTITWWSEDPNCDLDLWISVSGSQEKLYYGEKSTSFGHLNQDVRVSRHFATGSQESMQQSYETAELKGVGIPDVLAWINVYQSKAPVKVQYSIVARGQTIVNELSFQAIGGDKGKGYCDRKASPFWASIPLQSYPIFQ